MGNGSWQAADSLNPKYIQFNADGTLTFSASDQADFNSASRYQVTSDTTMIFYEEYGTTPIKFFDRYRADDVSRMHGRMRR